MRPLVAVEMTSHVFCLFGDSCTTPCLTPARPCLPLSWPPPPPPGPAPCSSAFMADRSVTDVESGAEALGVVDFATLTKDPSSVDCCWYGTVTVSSQPTHPVCHDKRSRLAVFAAVSPSSHSLRITDMHVHAVHLTNKHTAYP
jgi:hypothetical protein